MMLTTLMLASASSASARLDTICHNGGKISRCFQMPQCFRPGNGLREHGEQCDDNNLLNYDGCNSLGRLETFQYDPPAQIIPGRNNWGSLDNGVGQFESLLCGNGKVDIGEQCDPLLHGAICNVDCALVVPVGGTATAGDGIRQGGEDCDDGNDFDSDLCDGTSINDPANNFLTSGQEDCDDGGAGSYRVSQLDECQGNRWTFPQPTFIDDNADNGGIAAPYPRQGSLPGSPSASPPTQSSRYCRPVADDTDGNRNAMLARHFNWQAPFAGDLPPVPESANTIIISQANLETQEEVTNADDYRFQVFLDDTRVVNDAGQVLSTNTFSDAPALGTGNGQFRLCPWPSINRSPANGDADSPAVTDDASVCGLTYFTDAATDGCPNLNTGTAYTAAAFPTFDADANGVVDIPSNYFGYRGSVEPRDNFRDNVNQYDQGAGNRNTLPRTNRWIGDIAFTVDQPFLDRRGAGTAPAAGAADVCGPTQGSSQSCDPGYFLNDGTTMGNTPQGQIGKMIKDPSVDLTNDNLYDSIGSQFDAAGAAAIPESTNNNMPYRLCMALSDGTTGHVWRDTGFNVVVTRYCSVVAQDCNSFSITRTSTDGGSENLFLDDNRSFCMRLDTNGVDDRGYCVDPRKVAIDPSGTFYYNPVVDTIGQAPVDRSPVIRDMTPAVERDLIVSAVQGNIPDQRTGRREQLPEELKELIPTTQPDTCTLDTDCPAGENCCRRTKWAAEFAAADRAGIIYDELEWLMEHSRFESGVCFDPATQGCCENGYTFDRYKERCCKIGGILPVDQPCPCSLPEHCQVPETGADTEINQHMTCCIQQFGSAPSDTATCSEFLNFPHSWRTDETVTLGYTERRWTQTDSSHHWVADFYSNIVGSPESSHDGTGPASVALVDDDALNGRFLYRGVDAAALFPRTGLERQRFGSGTQSTDLRTPYAEGARSYPEGVDFIPTKFPVRPNSKHADTNDGFEGSNVYANLGGLPLNRAALNTNNFPQYINTQETEAGFTEGGRDDFGPDVDLPIQGIGAGRIPQIRDGVCPGRCIDTRVQICCNGNTCNQGYEKCCNSTCCNKFSESCKETTVHTKIPTLHTATASGGVNYFYANYIQPSVWTTLPEFQDYTDFDVKFEVCVGTGETVTPLVALQVYVLPTALLLMTLLAMLFVGFWVVRAGSHTNIELDLTGRLIVSFATIYVLFAVLFFFSAVWQYGIVLVLGGAFTILAGGTSRHRPRTITLVALIIQLVLVNFLLDPFNGNEFLSMSLNDSNPGGIFAQTSVLWTDASCGFRGCQCVDSFNGYFQYAWQYANHRYLAAAPTDSILPYWTGWGNGNTGDNYRRPTLGSGQYVDVRQENVNEVQTFGYCARDWIGTLLYLGGISTLFVLLTTVVLIVALMQSLRDEVVRSEEDVVETDREEIQGSAQ